VKDDPSGWKHRYDHPRCSFRLRIQYKNDEGRREYARARIAINNTVIINANANRWINLNYQVNTVK